VPNRIHRPRQPIAMAAPQLAAALLAVSLAASAQTPSADTKPASMQARTMQEILEASKAADWRNLDPMRTLYMDLDAGRVVIELAPEFAPAHVANIRALAKSGYWNGLSINRSQDNFVVQWGDPGPGTTRPLPAGVQALPPEFARAWRGEPRFVALPDRDAYAPEQGFLDGFAVAGDRQAGQAWLAHCYGTLAVGREEAVDSGTAAELYVVIGHAPRQLERNATVLGRALVGMELLAALPRGGAAMGFYETPAQRVTIRALRFGDELPPAERVPIEVLRTDSATFAQVVEARRNRRDGWYVHPAGHIDLCSVPVPVRRLPR
jgi:peptidylprolyl isomerase